MRRRARSLPFALALDKSLPETLHGQLREQLRQAILERRLAPGLRLPSSRLLAADCDCARGTALLALEQLVAEGYAETVPGAGTFVARNLPETLLYAPTAAASASEAAPSPARLSRRGRAALVRRLPPFARASGPTAFARASGPTAFALSRPAVEAFPFPVWARLLEFEWRQGGASALSHPFGDDRLRAAIAAYLGAARGFACDPACVVVVQGLGQGVGLLARLLLDAGEPAWVENPGYYGTRDALVAAGVRSVAVPVDGEGMSVAAARARAPRARLAVVTPAHQYPLGVAMSLSRRLELLAWAEAAGGWILEDDYDGEYRYAGRPLTPLRALDRAGRVAYAGSFSKVLFPALRLSYLVLPPTLVLPAARLMAASAQGASPLGQPALARFITEGHFAAHLRRTRRLYAERQATLVDAASRHLSGLLTVAPSEAGMHLVGRPDPAIADRFDEEAVAAAAAARGVAVSPLGRHYDGNGDGAAPGLLLGYAACDPGMIETAAQRLAAAVREEVA